MGKWTRRAVLATGGLVGGGLVLGIGGLALAPNRLGVGRGSSARGAQLATWVRIGTDDIVTVLVPHCEMGQGVHTALAMMLADELEADWNNVRVEEAPAIDDYANGYLARVFVPPFTSVPPFLERGIDYATFKLTSFIDLQVTGGSSSVRGTGQLGMRVAGAAARQMLLAAAAKRWSVPITECTARASHIEHHGSDRAVRYGELVSEAAQLDPPIHPPLKARAAWTLMGTPVSRLDIPSKVDGTARYGIDAMLPGMLYATIAAAPVFGARLASVDVEPALAMAGVKKVVQLDNAVAVVADGYWRALKALRALAPVFTTTPNDNANMESMYMALSKGLDGTAASSVYSSGDAEAALANGANQVEAEYRVPFLAHAALEPINATVRVSDGRCEVWTSVQDPLGARKVAAAACDLAPEAVTVHNQQVGGGFGRRLPAAFDFIDQAVRIAQAMAPTPVKLLWSREEDLQHDYYRPAAIARCKAALDARGAPLAWVTHFNGESGDGAAEHRYAIAHQDMRSVAEVTHVRLGSWRSVAHSQHGYFKESFIDELAHAAGHDPFEYRRNLLDAAPRHRAVLERAAQLSGWGAPLPPGHGRGIAIVESFGSIVAQVAQVNVVDSRIKVQRVWAAVDCGEVINPDTAAAQIEGGIIFGMSQALFSAITIERGRIVQSNFNDYLLPKLADAPRITVEFIRSGAPLGGLGEPGVPPIAPAIANAVFAATGQRLRSLPLRLA